MTRDRRKLFTFTINAPEPVTLEVHAHDHAEALDTFRRHYVGSHPYSMRHDEVVSYTIPMEPSPSA